MKHVLPFEKPVVELKEKIAELKKFTSDSEIDLNEEITRLENRLEKLEDEVYGNMQPWDRVQMARHPERPTTLDYIHELFDTFIECHGDRLYGDDEAIVGGVAKYKGIPVTVIGHQRGKDTRENIRRNFGMPHPEGYRKALRLMKQAEKFGRPVICFIDTKGAYPGKAAEERGQSEAIARNLKEMAGLTVPIVCIVIGEGGKRRCPCSWSRRPDSHAGKLHIFSHLTGGGSSSAVEGFQFGPKSGRNNENYIL